MSGLLRLVPGEGDPVPLAAGPPPGRSRPRWAADPIAELAREMAEVCAAAVHPDEIAAVLEAGGLTGEQIAERYGRRDAFELATELFALVPRAHPEPGPRPDPWRVSPGRFGLRSVVFTLPGLGYALGSPLPDGPHERFGQPAGTSALVASALVAWALNQALAHRAYVRLAAGGRAAAARRLAAGAPLAAALAAAAALALAAPARTAAFAAGQALYLAAATVLLVLGHERLLLLALLPTAAGGAALLVTDPPAVVGTCLLLATTGGALAGAGWQTVRALRGEKAPAGVPAPPLHASVPYGLFGLGCGVLTVIAALGGNVADHTANPASGPSVISLTLSMGAAEWLLYRCRGRALAALGAVTTPAGLLGRAARVLAGCVGAYLAVLTALVGVVGALWPGGAPPTGAALAALLALGAVLWTGLLLQAYGAAWLPALLCTGAAAAEAAALAPGPPSPLAGRLIAGGCAAVVLLAVAAARLGRITTHR
ncbi:hypothetical protein [Streptomyces luteosporeus]|uniref:Uncharacterized protein n=1 Tax=Streptomyces luteosporeus TaxID=173856 RepID=A0ABN3TP60_9ACTN